MAWAHFSLAGNPVRPGKDNQTSKPNLDATGASPPRCRHAAVTPNDGRQSGSALSAIFSKSLGAGCDLWHRDDEMEKAMAISRNSFASVLHAAAPAPDRADVLALYGRFIGDWDARIVAHGSNGVRHESPGEIHFGWILQGRAIQDVWMIPLLAERPQVVPFPVAGNWFGTTIRVHDPKIDAWRIYWIDPATHSFREQIGRPQGDDIVQE